MTSLFNIPYYNSKEDVKLRSSVVLNLIFTIIVMCNELTPLLERTMGGVMRLFFVALWMATSVLLPKAKTIYKPQKVVLWWTGYILIVFVYFLIGFTNIPLIDLLARIPLFMVPYMMVTIIRTYNLKEMEILWKFILAIFIFNIISNYLIFSSDPDVFERMRADDATSGWATNAGSSTFVIQCLFNSAIMWVVFVMTTHRKSKIYSMLLLLVVFIYMMFMNSRGTAMVIWFFMAILFYMNKKKLLNNSSMKSIIIWSLIIFGLVLVFSSQILDLLMSIFAGSERLNVRLGDMKELASGTSIEYMDKTSIGARYILWSTSVETFLSGLRNFLIGIGEHAHDQDIMSLIESGVGGHSGFFDLAATYGFLGIIIIFYFLKNTFSYIKSLCIYNEENILINIIFLSFVIYCFFNLLLIPSFLMVITIILPLTIILLNHKKI